MDKTPGGIYILGEKIKYIRTNLNLSQRAFANALHVSKSTIANYENDIREPTFSFIINLSSTYNLDINLFKDDKFFEYYKTHNIIISEKFISNKLLDICNEIEKCLHKISLTWQGVPLLFKSHVEKLHTLIHKIDIETIQNNNLNILSDMHKICEELSNICDTSYLFLNTITSSDKEILQLLNTCRYKLNEIITLYN